MLILVLGCKTTGQPISVASQRLNNKCITIIPDFSMVPDLLQRLQTPGRF